MTEQQTKKSNNNIMVFIIAGIVILAALVWAITLKNKNREIIVDDHGHGHSHAITEKPETHEIELPKIEVSDSITMEQIVSRINSFGLMDIVPEWHQKQAPDFTLKDINGKKHKLSDYRGRQVFINFWATWCPPCQKEIPEIINLRKSYPKDKLAILAISDESLVTLQTFAEKRGLNYTILQMEKAMESPYNKVRYIPTNFFIDDKGKIKVAVTNPMSEETMKMIIDAK